MIGALELVADKASKKPFDGMKVGQFCAKAAEQKRTDCPATGWQPRLRYARP